VKQKNVEQMMSAWEGLNPAGRALLEVLALNYQPANRTALALALNRLGHRDAQGRPLQGQTTLTGLLSDVLARGLLVLEEGRHACPPALREPLVRRLVRDGRLESMAAVVTQYMPLQPSFQGQISYRHLPEAFREARLACYRNDHQGFWQVLNDYNTRVNWRREPYLHAYQVLEQVLESPFDPWVLDYFSWPLLRDWFMLRLERSRWLPRELGDAMLPLVRRNLAASVDKEEINSLSWLVVQQALLRGALDEADEVLAGWVARVADDVGIPAGRVWLHVLRGEWDEARAVLDTALKQLRKEVGKKKVCFTAPLCAIHILPLIRRGRPEDWRLAEELSAVAVKFGRPHDVCAVFGDFIPWLRGEQRPQGGGAPPDVSTLAAPLFSFFHILLQYWTRPDWAKRRLEALRELHGFMRDHGYDWVAAECAELLHRLGAGEKYGPWAADFRRRSGTCSIVDIIQRVEPWSRSLDALAALASEVTALGRPATGTAQPGVSRLAWFVQEYTGKYAGRFSLRPVEQKLGRDGRWSGGRNVALKRLHEGRADFLSPQDKIVCLHLKVQRVGYYGQTDYFFSEDAWPALVGHPHVFRDDASEEPLEVVAAQPELQVEQGGSGGLRLRLATAPPRDGSILLQSDGPGRLRVISFGERHQRLAGLLGAKGLPLPVAESARVMRIVSDLAGLVTVHSDVAGEASNAREVAADPRPVLRLRPHGSGMRAAVCVCPLGAAGPVFVPGGGHATVITAVAGENLLARRDLAEEKARSARLLVACPSLADAVAAADGLEWSLDSLTACLELLQEVQGRPADEVVVSWPEGQALRVLPPRGFDALRLRLRAGRDWIGLEGGLVVTDDRVLQFKELFNLLAAHPGRFLPLDQDEFLALTEDLRKRLDELRGYSQHKGKGKELGLPPLAVPALSPLFAAAGKVEGNPAWRQWRERCDSLADFMPHPPSTLRAELRDYQAEGFTWLARLAHLGAGACLADDMGLGKTVQALALLLHRAAEGPALVVAPTSVCANWLEEARRFAPTLNVLTPGTANRRELVAGLGPLDVLVVSYGLLQGEEMTALLAEVEWSVVVLDEAQAIKNFQTRRSHAAMQLRAGFRCITTGTPIENHLGELWNLFRFLNPGLLGSLDEFNARFALPIEQQRDGEARRRLRRLIQPFILRRTKEQVLEELPPRTEVVLHVDLSPDEAALYEGIRHHALETLATETAAPAGARHLQILAEIMRLRRACCHPRLVLPDSDMAGSKLTVFGELVDELQGGRHKALVFSQFVDHLAIVRGYLEERGVVYQYLDGATPARQRQKAVEAFQAGDGDIFLISLKAGGVGLNLTAADYVIHLDPWWNPAVEDQASNRAHRIGQERPVTVYRLVARGSIEEQIIALHGKKRDLADSLLAGGDMSGRISAEELLRLIQGGLGPHQEPETTGEAT